MSAPHAAPITKLRWDFVADPPTRLLAELDLARTRLRRRKLVEARRAAVRLLRHLDAHPTPGLADPMPQRLAEIRADGLAVQAITSKQLGRDDGDEVVAESLAAYAALDAQALGLRPSGLAGYGMVLALAGRHEEAVEPLARAAEGGEDVSMDIVIEAGRQLEGDDGKRKAVRLLRAVNERYPNEPVLAAELAGALHEVGAPDEEASAHVDAGALLANAERYVDSLNHFALAAQAVPDHPLAALGRCQALLALGDVDEALRRVDELCLARPDLAGAQVVRALAQAQGGDGALALDTVDDALERFTDDLWLLDTRARLLLSSGRVEEAIAAVDKALDVDPTDRNWRGLRAEMLIGQGRDVDVELQVLRELATALPGAVDPAVRLARGLRTAGRQTEALDIVSRAREEHPDAPALLGLEVELLSDLGRADDAVKKGRRAIELGAALSSVAIPLARSLLATGNVADANELADQAVAADPESARAHAVRGLARHSAGDYEGAVDDLEAGLADPRTETEVRTALGASLAAIGSALYDKGEYDSALPMLEHAVEVDPRTFEARRLLAEVYRLKREYVLALEHANRGLEIDPNSGWLIGTRGQIQEALEDDESAEADLRRAVQLDANLGWAYAELGDFLRVRKRFAEALEVLGQAIDANPNDPWPWACKGAAEYALDWYDDAGASLNRALELDESYAWARAALSTTLADIDELAAARQHVERALELDPSMAWARVHLGWLELLEVFDDHRAQADPAAATRALASYEQALKEDPDVAIDELLGEAHLLAGDIGSAMATFNKVADALEAQGMLDAGKLMSVGWCRMRLGQHDEAVDAFISAMALDTSNVSAAFDLALTLLCAGRTDVALAEYAQAIGRARAVPHRGRQRMLLRVARRDLSSLAVDQLRSRRQDVDVVRALLDGQGGGDGAADRSPGLPLS